MKKYLEAALVVFTDMEKKYGYNGAVNRLPVMANIVAGLFQDDSIGATKIRYSINKILVLRPEELGVESSDSNQLKLVRIIRWNIFFTVKSIANTLCRQMTASAVTDNGLETAWFIVYGIGNNFSTCPNPYPPGDGGKLPGEIINGDQQYGDAFGVDFKHASKKQLRQDCRTLWYDSGKGAVLSADSRVADGTDCGVNKDEDGTKLVTVDDGTRCSRYGFDVCIQGRCKSVGCDHELGSGARFDRCRVCNGNGTSCTHVTEYFTEQWNKLGPRNARLLVELPMGTLNAKFKEI
ncbi:A disintegrin and metalloproteinase with thrombospondin motifs 6 [Stylophora pistillata]|uniref:A disintegrin and metalloproteinase with thrombospondin motifs 6 n=1 Tax=Stylophora pistillata TaxID=50429 RepID=A0A2B4STN9_STYPI|nr:A disintegrin and metalloproteinase with thrombospondin motifs 6 [Stylophora pistillata]